MRTRAVVALPGLAAAAYGLVLLLDLGPHNLRETAIWLVGGVLVHDAVLAPAVLVGCAIGARLLPAHARGPAVVGGIVLGTLTLVAVPVLGRFGAGPDNPTLLDRPYLAGWLVVAGLTLAGVLLTTLWGARSREARSGHGPGAGG